MSVAAIAPVVAPREVPAARRANRAEHYWNLIWATKGRRKERHAKDYIAAMLAGQPAEIVEAAVQAVENLIHPDEGK
jgi:hypothetical protein